ncbi:receptor-like protein EIX2 [Gossypium arboreum]|uniref:receptor-like protein EIX2 n=1 Tax=Gossypium arboreum TaxID=29729 RepID=UPI0022F14B0F|nr:receptor-like protein EIX2 [Gossypium arboreum]
MFDRKGKLSPQFIRPYRILKRVRSVAYQLELPLELDHIHDVFHISMLRRYCSDPTHIVHVEKIEVRPDLTFEEEPVQILDCDVKVLRRKSIPLVKEKCTDASVRLLCKDSERKALLEFKHSLQAMDSSGDDALSLWESTISPSLLKLHHLTSLNFNSNDFNGSLIPEFFGSLKKLKLLALSNANFKGPIPFLLGNLSMLETLRLGGNGGDVTYRHSFKKIFSVGKLEWLSHLSCLKEVDLSFTNLSNGNDCYWNNTSAIYPWLFNVSSNLVSPNLSSNKLKGPIPEAFGNMKAIQELYLDDNLLVLAENQVKGDSGLNEIGKLPDFRVLDLRYNLLNGSISKSIGQLSNLQVLRLAGNSFDGDVISEAHFSNFTNLQELDLSYTSLTLKFSTGWIPPFQPSQLLLCSCKLGPRFPNWIDVGIPSIDYLDISASGISDSLPYWFWDKFQRASYINMSFNQINVSPICNITGYSLLALFDLSNNLFSGVVSDCFGSSSFLTALNLGDNSFSGSLPSSLGSLTSLEMLSLRGNKFSGELPSSLQNCAKLKFLDLSDNELSGEIPMWIGQKLSSLVFLSLQGNQFKGRIPHQLCGLKYLQILDLSDGLIVLRRIIQLRYVDEALLTWKGTKQSYPQLGLLLAIDLSCNKLTGVIPEELSSLQELVALNLSRNLFNGKILQKIGHIKQLERTLWSSDFTELLNGGTTSPQTCSRR